VTGGFLTNKMNRFYTLIIFFLLTFNIFAQKKSVSGRVKNDLEENLEYVSIIVKETNTNSLSDCKGKFKIKAKVGDTLIFSKEGYLTEYVKITSYKFNRIVVTFNYNLFQENIKNDSTINKLRFTGTSQPLIIINGRIYLFENSLKEAALSDLTEDDIKHVIVFKGKKATDKFGKCAMNGAIWVTTKCNSDLED
jgi:hypothetical protein